MEGAALSGSQQFTGGNEWVHGTTTGAGHRREHTRDPEERVEKLIEDVQTGRSESGMDPTSTFLDTLEMRRKTLDELN